MSSRSSATSGSGDDHHYHNNHQQQQHHQHHQQLHPPRLTPQQIEAQERRNRMTQRRRDLTYQIRKQKRNDYIGRKRNLIIVASRTDNESVGDATTATSACTTTRAVPITVIVEEFKTVIQSYCSTVESSTNNIQQQQQNDTTMILQQLLDAFNSNNFQMLVEQQQQQQQATTTLSRNNLDTAIDTTDRPLVILDPTDHELAHRLVTNLQKDATSYPQTHLRPILQILVHLTSIGGGEGQPYYSTTTTSSSSSFMDDQYYGRIPETWTQLLLTTPSSTWIDTLVDALLHYSNETDLVCHVLGNIVGDSSRYIPSTIKPTMIKGLVRAVSMTPTTSTTTTRTTTTTAAAAAAWALTNMVRNDVTTYASSYCNDDLLSASVLVEWLHQPTIATQTAWMIASLTSREEQVVQYLCQQQQQVPSTPTSLYPSSSSSSLPFVSRILETIQRPITEDQSLPLIQALGNIACYASLVPPLLMGTSPALLHVVEQLLTQPRRPSQRDPILVHTTWLAGCLLVDVGIDDHPSTTMAAPTLIPLLMILLERPYLTLEERREIVSALWNAFTWPPQEDNVADQYQQQQQQLEQSSLFRQGQQQSVRLPFKLAVTAPFLQGLVHLMKSQDGDAVLASVHIVDWFLRRDEDESYSTSLLRSMQEEDVPDALTGICDSPMEEASEIAADLLDDYFYGNDSHDGHDDDPNRMDSLGGGFIDQGLTWPITGEGSSSQLSNDFGSSFSTDPSSVGMGRGMGRGRGMTLPSWMSK